MERRMAFSVIYQPVLKALNLYCSVSVAVHYRDLHAVRAQVLFTLITRPEHLSFYVHVIRTDPGVLHREIDLIPFITCLLYFRGKAVYRFFLHRVDVFVLSVRVNALQRIPLRIFGDFRRSPAIALLREAYIRDLFVVPVDLRLDRIRIDCRFVRIKPILGYFQLKEMTFLFINDSLSNTCDYNTACTFLLDTD